MNQRPSIHVEALSRTVNKGYYVPSQSKNIIVETEHKTLFRAWLGSEGYWLTLWLNGEPLMILDEVHVSKNLSVTAKSGDRVRVEIQRDGEPSYYKELSFVVKEDDVDLETVAEGIKLNLTKKKQETKKIDSKYRCRAR